MSDQINRLLGDTPGRTVVKLIVVSLVVGFVMAVFNLHPWDVFYGIRDFLVDLWHRGFHALGAVVITCCWGRPSSSRFHHSSHSQLQTLNDLPD